MSKTQFSQPNLIDRLVGYLRPAAGLRRLQQRTVYDQLRAQAFSPYDADTPSTRRKFYTNNQSPNQLTQRSAVAIRNQARQQHRNHDISRGILKTIVNNTIGPSGIGIEPQPRRADGTIHKEYAQALRKAYLLWSRRPEVTKQLSWSQCQRAALLTLVRDGECFAQELIGNVPYYTHSSAVPFSLELIEPDFVPYDYSNTANTTTQGIEKNAWGEPIAYWVYKTNPLEGNGALASDLKRIPADRMHHMALRDRIGQLRGVSEFASILNRLEDIKDYEESERIAAKIAAAITFQVKKNSPDGYAGVNTDSDGNTVPRSFGIQPGMVFDNLAVGEEIAPVNNGNRPNPNIITFRGGQLRAAAAGIGASYSSIARDYNGTYSAQRQELVEQYVHYAILTDEFTCQFVEPAYKTLVLAADLSGIARRPRDVMPETADDAMYIGQSMPWIDPLKEANAWVELTRAGFASEVEVMRKRGQNPDEVLEQISTWREQVQKKGFTFTSDGAHSTGGGLQQTQGTTAPGADPTAQAQAQASTLQAMGAAVQSMGQALASAPQAPAAPVFNVTMPEHRSEIHNHLPAPVVNTDVHVPETTVNVEAVMPAAPAAPAPVVNITNDVKPAPVTVNNAFAAKATQTVNTDPTTGDIVSTVTVYEGV